jgi:hypothetical protein
MEMKTKSIALAIAAIFMFLSTSFADEDSHKKAAEKLLIQIGMDRILAQTIENALNVQIQQQPSLAPYKEVMLKFFEKHMGFESLKDDLVAIYMEVFTEEELNDIMAFYATPTGRKTLEKLPELSAKGAQLGQSRVQQNIQELQEMIVAESRRIQEQQNKTMKE